MESKHLGYDNKNNVDDINYFSEDTDENNDKEEALNDDLKTKQEVSWDDIISLQHSCC